MLEVCVPWHNRLRCPRLLGPFEEGFRASKHLSPELEQPIASAELRAHRDLVVPRTGGVHPPSDRHAKRIDRTSLHIHMHVIVAFELLLEKVELACYPCILEALQCVDDLPRILGRNNALPP